MLIDEFLPNYDIRERRRIEVNAPIDITYATARRLDISEARLSMILFRLRGIPVGRFDIDSFQRMRFILLGEKMNEELLLGLVGCFWTPTGELQRLDRDGYLKFNQPGYAKAAWNFSLTKRTDRSTFLETETRVYCMDEASRKRFRIYWFFIGGFSGVIRREILKAVKKKTEGIEKLVSAD
jgi:hypothetical protein